LGAFSCFRDDKGTQGKTSLVEVGILNQGKAYDFNREERRQITKSLEDRRKEVEFACPMALLSGILWRISDASPMPLREFLSG
jgi:hypothetical protein